MQKQHRKPTLKMADMNDKWCALPNADKLLVAYSGGKDSLCVLDRAVKSGKHVEAFYMYLLPNLDFTEHVCQYAERRWGIKVHRIQHWQLSWWLREGTFRVPADNVKQRNMPDCEDYIRRKTGIDYIGYGYKWRDSLTRRVALRYEWGYVDDVHKKFFPIAAWTNNDVHSYLQHEKIQVPDIPGMSLHTPSGLTLRPHSLEFVRQAFPRDYAAILKVFPYAVAQADRAEGCRQYMADSRKKKKEQQPA